MQVRLPVMFDKFGKIKELEFSNKKYESVLSIYVYFICDIPLIRKDIFSFISTNYIVFTTLINLNA